MTGHPPSCPECVPCQGDDCEEAAYCTSEPGMRNDLCIPCQTKAMDGPDWQDADPLWTPPAETDAEYRARTALKGFDTTTNSYTSRRPA